MSMIFCLLRLLFSVCFREFLSFTNGESVSGTWIGLLWEEQGDISGLETSGKSLFPQPRIHDALRFYSKALRVASSYAIDGDKSLLACLFLNRANVLHNLGFLKESLRDCHRALRMDPFYAKAWYRRGKLNTLLGNYSDAIRDIKVSMSLESSLFGKKQLRNELKAFPDYQDKQTSEHNEYPPSNYSRVDHLPSVQMDVNLRCVSTNDKGRGMESECDIEQAGYMLKNLLVWLYQKVSGNTLPLLLE